jgi:hypothetical protein
MGLVHRVSDQGSMRRRRRLLVMHVVLWIPDIAVHTLCKKKSFLNAIGDGRNGTHLADAACFEGKWISVTRDTPWPVPSLKMTCRRSLRTTAVDDAHRWTYRTLIEHTGADEQRCSVALTIITGYLGAGKSTLLR